MADVPPLQRLLAHAALQSLVQRTALPNRFQRPPYVGDPFETFTDQPFFGGFIPYTIHLIKVCLLVFFLLSISAGSYLAFYHAAMPSQIITEPLYFDYTQPWGMLPVGFLTKTLRFCNNVPLSPWAPVDLFAKHTAWEETSTNVQVLPKPKAAGRLLEKGHAYFLETVLRMPESLVNQQAGVFGVVTELRSSNKTTLAISRRAVRIPYQSTWIANARKFVCLLPILLGAMEESTTVVVRSYRHYVEHADYPLVSECIVSHLEAASS
jgi:hypothetical protein